MAHASEEPTGLVLTLEGEDAALSFGARLAGLCRAGDVIALWGGLGMGKTVIARGIVRALLGTDEEVPSPTFTLVQPYEGPDYTVFHFDLYRLNDPEEAYELDIEDAFAEGLSLIEWPERLGSLLPAGRLDLRLSPGGDAHQRRVALSGGADWTERLKRAELHD
ncbi:MAG: tRNA (adenosine(37)-N6)-threonylcarbamoyltransferase complex ATPase subunit type 1 TsaE [Rhodospirillaceae bacterium]|nr:tRNA (adenosine(37)-N6)-threonylcarbamoyltransferase complex ATPase subunit type 1 TsaE [Magnetovibrio sp.]MAY67208.1 tRNA (adenosine(37)-N6)-threonylcarbamoyltransferase complex ATPase subunit type 1 TsaE [Rhodospirillaceae bacterium]